MKYYLHLFLSIIVQIGFSWGVQAQIISTIAGNGTVGFIDGLPATSATFNNPTAVALDRAGNIYINDQKNNCVRRIDHATGYIKTIAGTGLPGFGGDNGPATSALLYQNWGIAVDPPGNVYIADQVNHRVRKVDLTGRITTIAGRGVDSSLGDGGQATAAGIRSPIALALDTFGNLYVTDQAHFDIRKIDTAGIITTVAGCGFHGYTGDGGPAILATFEDTYGITADDAGNLYICDGGNNRVRKIDGLGVISTIAGNGPPGFSGDGTPASSARLYHPTGVVCDKVGNVYITDCYNQRIRKINSSGIINTIAGTGIPGFSGDGGRAIYANLNRPLCITIDSNENLYFSDLGNVRIREIKKALYFKNGHFQYGEVCQDVSTSMDTLLAAKDLDSGIKVTWTIYTQAHHGLVSDSFSTTSTGGMLYPGGFSYTPAGSYMGNDTFTIKVTNGIDIDFTTIYITVNPSLSYAGAINGPSYVCVGSGITLTDTTGNGVWSISNLNAIVNNGVVTGESPGTDSIRYTIYNACGYVTASKLITIYALPDAGKITGSSELCIGTVIFLSDTISGGLWSTKNPVASVNSTGTVTGVTAGIDTIIYTVSDAFCTNFTTHTVKVDPFPVAGINLVDTAICAGSTTSITGIPDGGIWKINNTKATFSAGTLTGVLPGTDTISYIISNFCGSDTANVSIKINSLPLIPEIIQNGTTVYAPAGYTSYQWSFDGVLIPGAIADSYLVANTGFYSVLVKNLYGCAISSSELLCIGCSEKDIIIYPNPTESIVYIKWCNKMIIKILCEDGKTVELAKNVNQADLEKLPNGDYLITIYDMDGKKIKTTKVTKWTK